MAGRSCNGSKKRRVCVRCLVRLPQVRAMYLIEKPQKKVDFI